MIEMSMYFGSGLLVAALTMLTIMPLVHGRAVRLTTRRMEGCIPSSMAEILADKDLLRAEFAASMRQLEIKIEQLRTKSAGQLAELGRRADAINCLKRELASLRDEVRPSEEDLAGKAAELERAKRALLANESELGWRKQELAEWSALADNQKNEILALHSESHGLREELDGVRNELKASEERHCAAAQKAERELAKTKSDLATRTQELAERSSFIQSQNMEITTLKSEVHALKEQLDGVREELQASEERHCAADQKADRELGTKDAEIAIRTQELAERSSLVESQNLEITVLKAEVQGLRKQLADLANELKLLGGYRTAERIAAARKLMEERDKFESFHHRVAELVQQLAVQSAEDKGFAARAQQLEQRLSAQTRMLDERETEIEHLRRELQIALNSEADLRVAMIESEARDKRQLQNVTADKAKLQAALERANGERLRLAYELANAKRQVEETWSADQTQNSNLSSAAARIEYAA